MVPEEVVSVLIKHYDLPDSLVRKLFMLLEQERLTGYPSLAYSPQYDDGHEDRRPEIRFAKGLRHILDKLPLSAICDLDDSKLSASLYELAGITDADVAFLYRLRTPVEMYQISDVRAKMEARIERYQDAIDFKQPDDDVSWQRNQLRRIKDELKELKDPEWASYLTQFWLDLLDVRVSFELPQKIRLRHTHVLGSSGAGKSVMLRHLIHQDIQAGAAVIVMAPKGELIPKVRDLACIGDRLRVFSPDHPVTLNLFDLGLREKNDRAINQTVSLINYVFASVLKADTTGMQDVLLNNCIRLLLQEPAATLLTLRKLLDQRKFPEEYEKYLPNLTPATREFFVTSFGETGEGSYQATKRQVRWRLESVFAENTAVESVLSQPRTSLDMHEVMAAGQVLLVDTSIAEYGVKGSAFLGRFFIGLVMLATMQRAADSRPVYFYIDECQTYLSDYITELLRLAREMGVGLTLAHHDLSELRELSLQLEQAVLQTGVKIVGQCDVDDAAALAKRMHLEPRQLAHQPPYTFQLYARDFTRGPVQVKVDLEYLDALPTRELRYPTASQDASPLLKAAESQAQYTPTEDSEEPEPL